MNSTKLEQPAVPTVLLQRIKIRKEDELRERLEKHPLYCDTVHTSCSPL